MHSSQENSPLIEKFVEWIQKELSNEYTQRFSGPCIGSTDGICY